MVTNHLTFPGIPCSGRRECPLCRGCRFWTPFSALGAETKCREKNVQKRSRVGRREEWQFYSDSLLSRPTTTTGLKQSVAQLTEVATFIVHFICSKRVRIISDWFCLITNHSVNPLWWRTGTKRHHRSRRLVWVDEVHSKCGNLS